MIDQNQAARIVGTARLALGASIWTAPGLTGRVIELNQGGQTNGLAEYVSRIAGARDVALGAGALLAPDDQKRQWLIAGGACDIADLAAGLLAGATGKLSRESSGFVSLAALGGVVLTALAVKR